MIGPVTSIQPISRPLAIALLVTIATVFGANHIAARITFDDGTGVLTAVIARAGLTALILLGVVFIQSKNARIGTHAWPWLALAGLLVTGQSVLVYSAVARIPVALALLVFNLFPAIYIFYTWLLGGPAPTRRAMVCIGIILFGLLFVLDIPHLIAGLRWSPRYIVGVLCGIGAGFVFAGALWVTEHRLSQLTGAVRTLYTLVFVLALTGSVAASGAFPGWTALPQSFAGWRALVVLASLYALAFSVLFVMMPRLDFARNAPAMNVEPIATLFMGWMILAQTLNTTQLIGALIVVAAIIGLSLSKH
jgi:drug/metabolite transporter (DMT)-like permease